MRREPLQTARQCNATMRRGTLQSDTQTARPLVGPRMDFARLAPASPAGMARPIRCSSGRLRSYCARCRQVEAEMERMRRSCQQCIRCAQAERPTTPPHHCTTRKPRAPRLARAQLPYDELLEAWQHATDDMQQTTSKEQRFTAHTMRATATGNMQLPYDDLREAWRAARASAHRRPADAAGLQRPFCPHAPWECE